MTIKDIDYFTKYEQLKNLNIKHINLYVETARLFDPFDVMVEFKDDSSWRGTEKEMIKLLINLENEFLQEQRLKKIERLLDE